MQSYYKEYLTSWRKNISAVRKSEGESLSVICSVNNYKAAYLSCKYGSKSTYFSCVLGRISRDRWVSPAEITSLFERAMLKIQCGNYGIVHKNVSLTSLKRYGAIRGETPIDSSMLTQEEKDTLRKKIKREEGKILNNKKRIPLRFELWLLNYAVKANNRRIYEFRKFWRRPEDYTRNVNWTEKR